MSIKQQALSFAGSLLKGSINIVGGNKASLISASLAEELSPIVNQQTDYGTIRFYCPGRLPELRVRSFLTKEPETLEWINSFQNTDVLWDIGANVGLYSLYAAAKGLTVLAYEPSPSNYYLLSKNIEINKLDNKIEAYCIAFNDSTKIDVFYMSSTELGGALSSFGEELDWQGKPFTASLKQAMLGFSIDDFIEKFNPSFPSHIKIDVDGIENKIIAGAKGTLADSRLKSVLVELDTARKRYYEEVTGMLNDAGLKLSKKLHASVFDNSEFSNIYNHIFVRE